MKILITGINGMVASYLAELCLKRGHEVHGTIRWQEDDSNIRHIKDKLILHHLNLNDMYNCIKVMMKVKPNAISHLAAESWVTDSFIHPAESIRTNGLGTYNILESVHFIKDEINPFFNPVIHVCSSSEVYGLVTEADIPIKETQVFNPANPYAVGKVAADMLARMFYTNYGLKTVTTRMFTHTCGRRKMLSAECNFARQIALIEAGKQKPIIKHGNLDSLRTWAHVEDACEAYYLILTEAVKFGEAYNIGGVESRTIGEMLDYMLSLTTINISLEQDADLLRKYDVTLQIPDVSKFRADYPAWQVKWKFEDIIKDVLEGWRMKVINGLER